MPTQQQADCGGLVLLRCVESISEAWAIVPRRTVPAQDAVGAGLVEQPVIGGGVVGQGLP